MYSQIVLNKAIFVEREIMRINAFLLWIIGLAFAISSCGPNPTPNPISKKIKQSLKIHDDNVNSVDLRVQNLIIRENARFYYNASGLLDSLDVYSDTTLGATLLKSLKLKYMSDRVRIFTYDTTGYASLDIFVNASQQITKMVDTFGFGYGFFFTYYNNRISNIQLKLDSTTNITNFAYDANNNLLQYVITDTHGTPQTRVNFEYDLSNTISRDLDIRFASGGIRFLYAGGVNVFSLANINYGLGNTHRITKRIEYNLQTAQDGNKYLFDYSTNALNEITNRKITVNDTIDVFYEYRYQ